MQMGMMIWAWPPPMELSNMHTVLSFKENVKADYYLCCVVLAYHTYKKPNPK